ncbi:poly(A) RNA polymerase gld-2 homolog B isoform X2 [Drosophila miranda]|uniref:poly(A) RNA polymerase gld-2 homolog B isoform X2 n=2 Tax=Drosophila miranda TaxID=7229 RepID=UPI00143F88E2|nr:poly(A) RNA polymerase gld-2 homolog B isoform X2 [Drosophila miranda]
MYATQRDDMKIFVAAEVAAADAATSTTATAGCSALPVQQQREFRPGSNLKYNGKYNSKTSNLLRQVTSYHNSITSINGLNEAASNTKNQQQQQPQMLYTNHSHSLARKKYFGSNSNLQQQQQSSYYQQQQQQQQNLNNNNLLMKNQNIIQQQMSDCKLSDGNNNNNSQKTSSKWLNNNNKKRSSPSTSIESTSSYYRSSPDSSTEASSTTTTAATSLCSNSSSSTSPNEDAETGEREGGKQLAGAAASGAAAAGARAGESLKAARPPRQQPLSFWKTNYPQQPTNQMKNQQVGMTVASQKEALAVEQQQQQQQGLSYDQRRNSGGGYQQHQQNYYQYYYPQPKQLTIASFLQKELLPEANSSSNSNSNTSSTDKNSSSSSNNNFGRHPPTGGGGGAAGAGSGGYQQHRYRNAQYLYQHYQQQAQAQQQQQHAQQQQQQHGISTHFRRKHSDNHGNNNKKMHYSAESIVGPQKSIEILPSSNFNAMHRRIQGGNGGKNGYYQHHYHAVIGESVGAATTPTSYEHQNLYNLTYVNVDKDACSEGAAAETGGGKAAAAAATTAPGGAPTTVISPAAGKLSLLSKPSITLTTATSPPVLGTTAPVAIPVARNMFVPPPPLPLALLSPMDSSGHSHSPGTTPTNMISCAQLDEAITAAAASGTATGEQQAPASHSPNFPSGVPFLIQQQPPPPHSLKGQPPQQLFFHFGEAYANPAPPPPPPAGVWPHPSSPCYPPTVSPHSVPGHRSVSPTLSSNSSSLGSESHWSGNSSRLTGPSLSPSQRAAASNAGTAGHHQAHMHGHNMNVAGAAFNPSLSHHVPTSPISNNLPWYEVILPPDRFLTQARNMELTVQPEELLCNSKFDKLSMQIWERFRRAQQTTRKFKIKMRLWRFLLLWMIPMFAKYRIWLVGSTITGFGTDTSDVDMCLVGGPPHLHSHHQQHHYQQHQHHGQNAHPYQHQNEKRAEALIILNLFQSVLKKTVCPFVAIFRDFNLIEARVPILRFRDILNAIEVDLNFNNCVGIMNTYLLQLYAQLDWRTRPLVVVVKLWAQYHDINDAKRMTISSYSLVLMVLHYLQYGCTPHVLPCLHTLYPEKFQLGQQDCFDLNLIETIDPYPTQNHQTLGELFLGFFKYYSYFDFRNHAISVRTGGVLPVSACRLAKSCKNDAYQWKELNIEEPFDLSNTARSVYDFATFERVKATFGASARALEHTLDINSVFSPHFLENQFANQPQYSHGHAQGQSRGGGGGGGAGGSTSAATAAGRNNNINTNMSPTSGWVYNRNGMCPIHGRPLGGGGSAAGARNRNGNKKNKNISPITVAECNRNVIRPVIVANVIVNGIPTRYIFK